ncbi:hypothetical protein HPB52_017240 [Rhipicephalus sanguineus]|uniref:Uncharacterized protein n=1 Tax=Rhipicephalus sanguineus TaxID=34632 RepID=A0A9D4SZC3_RHISA|nr:hypothetical protein HPB52_017240 [Rhipicephalus sanguineus]
MLWGENGEDLEHKKEGAADIVHMVWACHATKLNLTREDWEAALLGCSDLASQKVLVDRGQAAVVAKGLL